MFYIEKKIELINNRILYSTMSRKVKQANLRQTPNGFSKYSKKSKISKERKIWNSLNMNVRDLKMESRERVNTIPDKEKTAKLEVEVGISTIKGCRGGECEDEHYHHSLELTNVGQMDIVGVFDGHSGKQVATFLKQEGYPILMRQLRNRITSAEDKDGFIEALGDTQREWLEKCPATSGSTVVLSILVHQTQMTYNLCIGDGRFYYFNSVDGELIQKEIETYDYATNEKETYIGSCCNAIHQINGKVFHLDGSPVTSRHELNCQKLSPMVFDKYKFNIDDERQLNWKEWRKWNLDPKANSSGYLKFPKYSNNAYRMDDLQPSRSLGKDEKCIKVGTLYMIQLDEIDNVMGSYCCDGIDDNKATNQETFGRFVVDFGEANEKFFENHLGVKHMKKGYNEFVNNYPQPSNESEITEKLDWLQKSLDGSNPLSILDDDWKNGVNDSREFFHQNGIMSNDCQSMAERMTRYVEGRMSGDNVTVAIMRCNNKGK